MKKTLTFSFAIVCFISVFSQTNIRYTHSDGGFCSTSILLSSDGTYKYESGCESSSNISFGTWTQNKDTIKFKQIETKDFKILDIIPTKIENSKVVSVRIFDQNRKNITQKISVKQYVQGKGNYSMTLDSSRTVKTDLLRDSGIIMIEPLEKIFIGSMGVKVDAFSNFDVIINIPSSEIYKIGANFTNIGDFQLLKRKNELLSVETYIADNTQKAFRIKYQTQK
jgi:hypothetical protein